MTRIIQPLFIGGPGRSGTTLLLQLLSVHPSVTWFSGWTNRFPDRPYLAALSRVNDLPALERATRKLRRWPRPAEAYGIWNHYFPGFSVTQRDHTRDDVTSESAAAFSAFVAAHLRWHGKDRFLTKYTGWPRFDFLHQLFPDARLLYIDRDPRAVVGSYVKQQWWLRPEAYAAMPMTTRLEFYATRYVAMYRAKRAFREGKDYTQLYYERLVGNMVDTVREICERADLPFTDEYQRRLDTFRIYDGSNAAWKKLIPAEHHALFTTLLAEPLAEMNYE